MAHDIKLEVYTLKMRKIRDNTPVKMDSVIDNIDFLDFFKDYITSFDSKLSLSETQQKTIQFQKENIRVNIEKRRISGVVESGDYGLESRIVDVKTGIEKYQKTVNDTDIKPFYFLLHLPKDSEKAFIVLQRIGIYGINGVFKTHLELFFKKKFEQYILEFSPFVSRKLAQSFIDNGAIKELSLRRYNLPSDIADKLGMSGHKEDILSIEIRIVAKQTRALPFNNRVNKFIKNPNVAMFDIKELSNLGFDGEHKSSIRVKLGKSTRTVDLSETGQIRPYYDISEDVIKDSSGHPEFESINSIAISLMNDLIFEITN